jgi:hypothetical protein
MATRARAASGERKRRRVRRSERRDNWHQARYQAAETGEEALDAALDWIKTKLAWLELRNPAAADRARRSLADQIAQFARNAN